MASNLYATLAEYKQFATSRGQSVTADTNDDAMITTIIESVSRYVDGYFGAGRRFYPSIQSMLFDIPSGRSLRLSKDLLEVITLTNGDGINITSTEYILSDPNYTPYYQIALRNTSTTAWIYGTNGGWQQIITLLGVFGYRQEYSSRGWVLAGTLGAAITDTTTKAFTMTAGHTLAVGQIIKIDNEIYNVSTVVANTITPNQRGDNGSTAVIHPNGAIVYTWSVQEEIKLAVLESALGVNSMRTGQPASGKMTITATGVVLRPEEVPPMAQGIFESYRKRVA